MESRTSWESSWKDMRRRWDKVVEHPGGAHFPPNPIRLHPLSKFQGAGQRHNSFLSCIEPAPTSLSPASLNMQHPQTTRRKTRRQHYRTGRIHTHEREQGNGKGDEAYDRRGQAERRQSLRHDSWLGPFPDKEQWSISMCYLPC